MIPLIASAVYLHLRLPVDATPLVLAASLVWAPAADAGTAAERGADVFVARCAVCHGVNADGDSADRKSVV